VCSSDLRRLGGTAAFLAVMVAVLIGLSNLGILFPASNRDRTLPPTRPQVPPPTPDKVLYVVRGDTAVPLRLGVIDVYDQAQKAWLLPPYDTARLKRIKGPASFPVASAAGGSVQLEIQIGGAAGHDLPSIASAARLSGTSETITFDPRTETLGLADRPVYSGFSYRLAGPGIPTGKDLE